MECIFCKIANKNESADVVYENENIIAFRDINPKAPTHILIVPKKHVGSMKDINEEDRDMLADLLLASRVIALEQKVDEGYKLLFNVGKKGGQVIDHVHLHLFGGWE